jgi:putative holliday junction resolvase
LLRPGRRLAIDVGRARIGLAITDIHAILASPLATVQRTESIEDSVNAVLQAALDSGDLLEIYVGMPVNLRGESTLSTDDSLSFAEVLQARTEVPVRLLDERLTTSMANAQLKQVGKSQKEARSTIDQMAAVAILEFALSVESNTGNQPGLSVEDWRHKYE